MALWIGVGLAVLPELAQGASGDKALTLGLGGAGAPAAVEGHVNYEHGISPLFSIAMGGTVGRTARDTYGIARAGLRAQLDVVTWVPAVTADLGVHVGDGARSQLLAEARLGLRRYLDFDWSLAIDLGMRWVRSAPLGGVGGISLTRHF